MPPVQTFGQRLPGRWYSAQAAGKDPGVLGGVGVAEHDLLPTAPPGDLPLPGRLARELAHDRRSATEVVEGLEERDDVEA